MEPIPQISVEPPKISAGHASMTIEVDTRTGWFRGRLNRRNFFFGNLLVLLLSFVIGSLDLVLPNTATFINIYALFIIIYLIIAVFFLVSLTYRRLHDIGQAGWLWILYLVPVVDAFYFFILLCYPGDSTANTYGKKPENRVDLNVILGKR